MSACAPTTAGRSGGRRATRSARGQIDAVLGMGFVAHHLIEFTREALRGEQNASFYSTKTRSNVGTHREAIGAMREPA